MKYYELNKQEEKVLNDFEKGEFISVPRLKEQKNRYNTYAKNTLNKTKNINLRLSQKDLQKLKSRAAKEGLPYQTLATSILHRFVNEARI